MIILKIDVNLPHTHYAIMAVLNVFDVANYIVYRHRADYGDVAANLGIQKLLYYSQGFSLAIHDKQLFDQPIHKWSYGPAVRIVFERYREKYPTGVISPPSDLEVERFSLLSEEHRTLLNDVYEVYGQFSAYALYKRSISEPPLVETALNQIISESLMQSYFKTLVI